MTLEQTLASTPAPEWKTDLAIVFDWYDGPRQGVCRLAAPAAEFFFDLLDERPTPDDLDDRLFRLSEIPPGSVEDILSALRDVGRPTGPVWTPIWRFSNEAARAQAENRLRALAASKRSTTLVVYTRDMTDFLGCWRVDPCEPGHADWFAALGVPPPQPAEAGAPPVE